MVDFVVVSTIVVLVAEVVEVVVVIGKVAVLVVEVVIMIGKVVVLVVEVIDVVVNVEQHESRHNSFGRHACWVWQKT